MGTNRRGLIGITLGVMALLLMAAWPGATAPARITPGYGIGPLALGMPAAQVRLVGRDVTPKISGDTVVFDFPKLRLTAWVTDERVVRVRTRHPQHQTAAGVHPGEYWTEGILGMCGGMVMTSELADGAEFSCPFVGISFEVKNRYITGIAVTRPARR